VPGASAYLDTRVSLFANRLWPESAFEELLDASDEGMAGLLARRGLGALAAGYAPVPGQIEPGQAGMGGPDPRSLEQRIIAQMLEETRILLRPLTGAERVFLEFWTARFEMSNVKTLIRSKMRGERAAAALSSLTPMGAFARLDNDTLARAEDLNELLRRLESGPYAGIVRRARRAFEQSHDPFHLDAALDQGYYVGLVERARPLEAGYPRFAEIVADRIDRMNLIWLLRYRYNYGLPPGQVYYLLIDSHYGLPSARLRELAALDSVGSVLAALPAAWQQRLAGVTDTPGVVIRLDQLAAQRAQAVLRARAPGLSRAFAYLTLRERELRGVRAILRGRLLGLATEDIRVGLRRAPEMH